MRLQTYTDLSIYSYILHTWPFQILLVCNSPFVDVDGDSYSSQNNDDDSADDHHDHPRREDRGQQFSMGCQKMFIISMSVRNWLPSIFSNIIFTVLDDQPIGVNAIEIKLRVWVCVRDCTVWFIFLPLDELKHWLFYQGCKNSARLRYTGLDFTIF